MDQTMTLAEIRDEFDGEWVLIGDPELAKNLKVKRGKVLWHSKDRDEVYRKALELRPKHGALLYMGTIPEGSAVVL